MSTSRLLGCAAGVSAAGEPAAQGVDFDGVNDYLSRSSDLIGNVDSKTFTLSFWVSSAVSNEELERYIYANENGRIVVGYTASTNRMVISGTSSAGALVFRGTIDNALAKSTHIHVLLSIDLANESSPRVYLNDVDKSCSFSPFTNTPIDFSRVWHHVGGYGGGNFIGRLSHVFLDYTYRDLSIEANRRLFITTDRKPALNQAALNPILYLPMKDAATAHINEGTGGNFTLNGTMATSGRGANQFNAVYSDLDGSADYLSRTSALVGVSDGKEFTLGFIVNTDSATTQTIFDSQNLRVRCYISGSSIAVYFLKNDNTVILNTSYQGIVAGRSYHVLVSCDMTSQLRRWFSINGTIVNAVWSTYVNDNINFADIGYAVGARITGVVPFNGRLGNVFFDTRYIDLSNPDNLAKFVTGTGIDAKPADMGANGELPFGTPPLIYLPMYANNAGKNYGTGGDFTANSAPYIGARGASEYWGNKADFDGSTGYLARTSALVGVSDGKTASVSFWFRTDTVTDNTYNIFSINTLDFVIQFNATSNDVLRIYANNGIDFSVYPTSYILANTDYFIQLSIDRTDYNKTFCYINGVAATKSGSLTNTNTMYSSASIAVGAYYNGSSKLNGKLSEFYFTTDYIDFSQEANRLKFRDAFGNPVALLPQIEAGTLPNPAIYMRFDPANFGKNSGTGGDFTINGTITDGGQL